MKRRLVTIIVGLVVVSVSFFGCKGRSDKSQQVADLEGSGTATMDEMAAAPITEPAQMVASEPIPPTATPQIAQTAVTIPREKTARDMNIQRALKAAGFYAGAIDGKIGPRTKKAIGEFQKAKGLKVDGKVGPKTWAELEKYLMQQ